MEKEFDIDISGDEALPPGVQPGNLGGTDDPPEDPTPVGTTADELDASFDAALGGDGFEESADPPDPPPVVAEPAPEPVQEAPQEPPKPAPKKRAKKKAKAKPASSANSDRSASGSGPAARLYAIFQKHQAEINGQIMEAFVRVAFADPDDAQAAPVETIKARNRDTALYRAGKLFGHGFEGTLVATPVSMWEEKLVRNKPREQFHVEVGS